MQLFAGADGRYRTPLWPFSTITSRAAPNGAAYPFTVPSWCRFTMIPGPGKTLLYLDFSSMEFGVAAGLSRAPRMLADYEQEPYLVLPMLAGQLPRGATKDTHGEERDRYKPMILAVQYYGGSGLLARRLGLSRSARATYRRPAPGPLRRLLGLVGPQAATCVRGRRAGRPRRLALRNYHLQLRLHGAELADPEQWRRDLPLRRFVDVPRLGLPPIGVAHVRMVQRG